MGLVDLQSVEHTQGVKRHVVQAVRRFEGEAEFVFKTLPEQVWHTQLAKLFTQASVTVVKTYHPKSSIRELPQQARWPGNQLHAQTHDEQYNRQMRCAWSRIFNFNLNIICSYFHSLLCSFLLV